MIYIWQSFGGSFKKAIIQKFSRQRLENLWVYYHGRIMQCYYKLKIKKPVTGMKRKRQSIPGVLELYNGIFNLSITIVCSKRRRQCFIFNSRKQSFEQSANSQREPEQCKELGTGWYVWWWIFYYDAETFQDGSGKAEHGAGKIRSSQFQ